MARNPRTVPFMCVYNYGRSQMADVFFNHMAIDQFTDARNAPPVPLEWTNSVVHPDGLKQPYADS